MAETASQPSASCEKLFQLLEKNHQDHAMMLPDGSTHNHMAHILISAYRLNCSAAHLQQTYDVVAPSLIPYKLIDDSIQTEEDLFQHLGDQKYQRAFVEFFDRRLLDFHGDWRGLVRYYLYDNSKPMLEGLVGGFAHPLILLADAVDVRSAQVAVEALALTAYDWNALHAFVDAQSSGRKPEEERTVLEVLEDVREDNRFDGMFEKPGVTNTMLVLQKSEIREVFQEYLGAINVTAETPGDIARVLQELIHAAILLLCTVHKSSSCQQLEPHKFDFYLTHQLTFCWCVQTLLPLVGPEASSKLLKVAWLMMLLTLITQLRPKMKPEVLASTPLPTADRSTTWARLTDIAIGATKDKGMDPHFVKVIRTLKEFAQSWPEQEETFLSACVRFEGEFSGWTGFGEDGEVRVDVKI